MIDLILNISLLVQFYQSRGSRKISVSSIVQLRKKEEMKATENQWNKEGGIHVSLKSTIVLHTCQQIDQTNK